MPVRMLNFLKEPPPARNGRGANLITKMPEWEDAILALGAGLKPQEYISITIPKEHQIWRSMKHPAVAFCRTIKEKIAKNKLPYDAYVRADTIYIVGRSEIA